MFVRRPLFKVGPFLERTRLGGGESLSKLAARPFRGRTSFNERVLGCFPLAHLASQCGLELRVPLSGFSRGGLTLGGNLLDDAIERRSRLCPLALGDSYRGICLCQPCGGPFLALRKASGRGGDVQAVAIGGGVKRESGPL